MNNQEYMIFKDFVNENQLILQEKGNIMLFDSLKHTFRFSISFTNNNINAINSNRYQLLSDKSISSILYSKYKMKQFIQQYKEELKEYKGNFKLVFKKDPNPEFNFLIFKNNIIYKNQTFNITDRKLKDIYIPSNYAFKNCIKFESESFQQLKFSEKIKSSEFDQVHFPDFLNFVRYINILTDDKFQEYFNQNSFSNPEKSYQSIIAI